MKITDLKDKELIDYLLTSDFIESYKSSEYIYLLKKLRNFYRIVCSKTSSNDDVYKSEIERLKSEIKDKERIIKEKDLNINTLSDENKLYKNKINKKLSFYERLVGQISKKDLN